MSARPLTEKKLPILLKAYDSVEELLEGNAEYVIEIASGQAVEEDGLRILNAGKNLIITSVGALADEKLMEELREAAQKADKKSNGSFRGSWGDLIF